MFMICLITFYELNVYLLHFELPRINIYLLKFVGSFHCILKCLVILDCAQFSSHNLWLHYPLYVFAQPQMGLRVLMSCWNLCSSLFAEKFWKRQNVPLDWVQQLVFWVWIHSSLSRSCQPPGVLLHSSSPLHKYWCPQDIDILTSQEVMYQEFDLGALATLSN